MSKAGWVAIYRKLMDDDIWLSEKFTRGQAWVDLIALANFKSGYIRRRNGQRIDLARGQVGYSEVKLAERWQWTRGKVKRFLQELVKDNWIKRETGKGTLVITILNYEEYQNANNSKIQQGDQYMTL